MRFMRWRGGWLMAVVLAVLALAGAEPKLIAAPLTAEQRAAAENQAAEQERAAETSTNVEDFLAAAREWKEVQALRTMLYGESDWRVTDARVAAAHVEALAALRPEQRQRLRQAIQAHSQGKQLTTQGKYSAALPLFQQARADHEAILGAHHLQTVTLETFLARNLEELGKYTDAERLHRHALAVREKALGTDHPATAASCNNLALNLQYQGRYGAAESLFRQALAVEQKVLGEDDAETATCCHNLAGILEAQGKYRDGEVLSRRALAVFRKVLGPDHPTTALAMRDVAVSLHAQGKYAEAEPLFRCALALHRAALGDEHPNTAGGWNSLAFNLTAQGRYAEAEPLFRQTLAIRQKVLGEGHPDTAVSYNNLGLTLNLLDRHTEAEPILRRALALVRTSRGESHPFTARSYNNLAANLDAQRRYAEAEPLFRMALELHRALLGNSHPDTATGYCNVATSLSRQHKYAEAEPLHRRALVLRQQALGVENPDTALSYKELADNLKAQGKYADALAMAQTAAQSFAVARRRITFQGLDRAAFATERSPLPLLAALHARAGHPTDAWQALEDDLARGLLDDLTAAHQRLLTDAERRREIDLYGELDQLDKQITTLTDVRNRSPEQQQRLEQLRRDSNRLQAELTQFQADVAKRSDAATVGKPYALARIQKQLAADAALVAWLDTHEHHWACVVRAAGPPVWVALPGSGPKGAWTVADKELPTQVRARFRDAHADPDWHGSAARLANQRLVPLASHLSGIQHLVVLPSRSMAGIPVEVLTNRYSVSYAPSGTLFAHLHEQPPPASRSLLALGDPVFPPAPPERLALRGGTFAPLPGTRHEVEAITRLFANPKVLLGPDASEQALDALRRADRLKGYRYLHLATHGVADARVGLRSFLALSRDRLPDALAVPPGQRLYTGELTADHILRHWQLDADLVTLSACETGLGQQEGGEGYVGFSQALFLAGARSLVLSQWKVDDTATALLMQRFYGNLLGQRPGLAAPLGKAAALAEAKRGLRELDVAEATRLAKELPAGVRGAPVAVFGPVVSGHPFEHPYYWAAFILIGDPGDISQARAVLAETPAVAANASAPAAAPRPRWWPWVGGLALVGVFNLLLWRWCRGPVVVALLALLVGTGRTAAEPPLTADWGVPDARLAVVPGEKLAGLDAEQRRRLKEAE